MAVATIVFGVAFELIGSRINRGRDSEAPNDWVFVVLNTMFGLARIVFTGYGFLQLLPYLVFSNDANLGPETRQASAAHELHEPKTDEGNDGS